MYQEERGEKKGQNEKLMSSVLSMWCGRCLCDSRVEGSKTQERGMYWGQKHDINILWAMMVKVGRWRRG